MSEEDWGQMLEEQEKQQQEQQLSSKVLMLIVKLNVPVLQITLFPTGILTHLSMQLQSSLHVKDSPAPAAEPSDSAQPAHCSILHTL